MKKFLASSVTALLLSGCISAFAAAVTYTDPDSGFKLKTQPAWMKIGGKSFYGLAGKPDQKDSSLNVICAYTAEEIREATGKKFTTEEFREKYKDLQLLERNGLAPDKVNYLPFMPDPYEIKPGNKLSLAPKELLDNSTISISTDKKNRQPYVYLHLVGNAKVDQQNGMRRPVDMQIALTSENNMLYAVVSVFPLPDLKAQKARVEEATPFSKDKVRSDLAADNKEKMNGYTASRRAFIKGLSFFPPVKEEEPYGFDDALLGGHIRLPEGWAYVQVSDDAAGKKMPVKLTVATPSAGVSDFLAYREEAGKASDTRNISELNFQKIKELALFASARSKDKKTFAELFDSQLTKKLVIEKFIKDGLSHPSVKEIINIQEVDTEWEFDKKYGTIKLSGTGSVKNNYLFNVNANLMFTPQNFGMTAYITRDDEEIKTDTKADTKNLFEKITLVKE